MKATTLLRYKAAVKMQQFWRRALALRLVLRMRSVANSIIRQERVVHRFVHLVRRKYLLTFGASAFYDLRKLDKKEEVTIDIPSSNANRNMGDAKFKMSNI